MNAYQKFSQLAQQVTDEVIAELQKGKVLWQQPWGSYGLPKNYSSNRPYGGFNAFYLHHITEKNSFTAPYFLTFRQAQEQGGSIRRGEKGTRIVYWKVYESQESKNAEEQPAENSNRSDSRFVPFLWTVFNIDQVDGVDFQLPAVPNRSGQQVIEACQQVVDSFPSPAPQIRLGGSEAWYAPALDRVQVPEPKQFSSAATYHATLFHELIHATGHPTRLNRFSDEEKASRFGDEAYSKEELVAEMGASFLCAFTGIREQVFPNSVAYLQGWMRRLRNDRTVLLYAAARAFKAASYILELKVKETQEAPLDVKAAA
ncbi:ArdC family protein [Pontibacter litorisediminis]|uniref:ArdC family protein n=1 Tax=Pontibacter litorisediminis TaxID=1846260 RepID=UPI0023ED56D9|nr:zincin-like metallopeptidase domain-containing protein [Pontibacter litorisediminis]